MCRLARNQQAVIRAAATDDASGFTMTHVIHSNVPHVSAFGDGTIVYLRQADYLIMYLSVRLRAKLLEIDADTSSLNIYDKIYDKD